MHKCLWSVHKGQISNPAWGCGPDRANPDRGAQRRGQNAAWFRPKYECWIAIPTCPFTFDLFDLRRVAMMTGRITFLRPAATATGRTARSCSQFSDQNVYVTSRSMWEPPFSNANCSTKLYYPGQKKKEPYLRFVARRTLLHHVISCTITSDQRRQKSRITLPCADRSWSSMISQDRTVFFSPRISGMVLFFCPGK